MKTRSLVAIVVLCDVLMAVAGIPLVRLTWLALTQHRHDTELLRLLLGANLVMLAVCLFGFFATAIAGTRCAMFVFRRFSTSFARPTREL